jgi:GT2 family glycosyltransferase/glycosyltransferase involved in cell wall biosynthesis
LSPNSSQFNKQHELIRSLQKQLEATERELAGQKWVFQQFLQSPSWRMTYPIRWLAKQLRALRNWLMALFRPAVTSVSESLTVQPEPEPAELEEIEAPSDLKVFFTHFCEVQLQIFLSSTALLPLPHCENPEISVIVVLFNRAELTLACLRSLAENYSELMELIIVDNASTDETAVLLDRLRGARIIRNSENRNFLLAVNQAAREARGEYLLLLNNDAQVLPGTLRSVLATIRSAPDIGAAGGRLIFLDGTLQEAGSIMWRDGSCLGYGRGDNPFAPMYMFRRDVDYCSGAFLLTPRSIWNQTGGFDEIFKPAYYEETDYCARLWERGLRVVYDPNAVVVHYEFASSDSAKAATDLQRDRQRIFANRHQGLLSNHYSPDLNNVLPARMKDGGKKRVLFIDDQVPHTWLGSGFPRSRAILHSLLRQNCFVTFYPLSAFEEDWTSVYSDMPSEVEFMMRYGPPLLEPFLRNRHKYYDTILVSRPHNMKMIKPILEAHPDWFEETQVLYDAEAIFVTREITFRQLTGSPLSTEEAERLLGDEMALAACADRVVSVADSERPIFEKHGIQHVHVLGHTLLPQPTPRKFDARSGMLFVGAIHEEASPNADSVIWFLEEILPRIQRTLGSDIRLTIAGVNKSDRVKQLAGPNVRITGHLPDLTELYDMSRIFIAPTRYAAGLPHKVHEAAARGLPIVATPLLATQLGWQDGDTLFAGSDAASFADKCVELYTDEEKWIALRNAALKRIQVECSEAAFDRQVNEILLSGKERDLTVSEAVRD